MSTILVMPDGHWLAHVSRPLEIALVLRSIGHTVVFAGEGRYMQLPRNAGFEVLTAKTVDPQYALTCSRRGRANWYDYQLLKACVADDIKLFRQLRPDLVLGDFRLSLSTSCEVAHLPLAVVLNAAWTNYSAVRMRAPEHILITRIVGKRLATWMAPWITQLILALDARPYRKLRRELGLRPRTNIWDVWRGDLNLLADIPEYWPTKDLPAQFQYIGPIIWEPAIEPPRWLADLDPERPTIYFTMGSTGSARFFQHAIEIFGNSEYQCIMTTAGMVKLAHLPANFRVVDFAPGGQLMEKSALVVCHGGNGTIYQAMAKGVPIIGIPTMHDQEFNLDRVVALGMGIHLSELRFKPAHLVRAVEAILAQPSYKANAQKYQRIVAHYDGPRTGAAHIHAYLQNRHSAGDRHEPTVMDQVS